MAGLKLSELLKKLKKQGINISKRTFEYYQREGLLPKPYIKRVGVKGRGVYGYYAESILSVIKKILELKRAGNTIQQIKEFSEEYVLEKCLTVLKANGVSGFHVPELMGDPSKDYTDDKTRKGAREYLLKENFRWWNEDKEFEIHILNIFNREIYPLKENIWRIRNFIGKEIEPKLDENEKKGLLKIQIALADKSAELEEFRDKAEIRLIRLGYIKDSSHLIEDYKERDEQLAKWGKGE